MCEPNHVSEDAVASHPAGRSGLVAGLLSGVIAMSALAGPALERGDAPANGAEPRPARGEAAPVDVLFDAQRAYGYLVKVCRIGRRPSGSTGMAEQLKLITEHFQKLGGEVRFQAFDAAHPIHGDPVRMNNILVSWHPKSTERVLIACHYDTRPFPDMDRKDPQGEFVGANDGASGVALLMELGHHMAKFQPTLGVDFVFFDGEELVFNKTGKYFLGSEHFAKQYRDRPPAHTYRYGVVIDMVGDKNLRIAVEKNSRKLAPEPTESLWATAKALGVKEFVNRVEYEIQDDHLPLNEIAGIPTTDIIDFDYPYWHTTQDVPQNCDGRSLAKVARVLVRWMQDVPPKKR